MGSHLHHQTYRGGIGLNAAPCWEERLPSVRALGKPEAAILNDTPGSTPR